MKPELTRHSKTRLKERCGATKSSQEKIAATALEKGIRHTETSGSLRRYLDMLYLQERNANNIRIWGDKVFLFRADRLITVLQLPQKYMQLCVRIREKKEE